MSTLTRRARLGLTSAAIAVALAIGGAIVPAQSASAAVSVVANCQGYVLEKEVIPFTGGRFMAYTWYSAKNGGTYCTKVMNLTGQQTRMSLTVHLLSSNYTVLKSKTDSGAFSNFAGGIQFTNARGKSIEWITTVYYKGIRYEGGNNVTAGT